jgi:hypothetical protein
LRPGFRRGVLFRWVVGSQVQCGTEAVKSGRRPGAPRGCTAPYPARAANAVAGQAGAPRLRCAARGVPLALLAALWEAIDALPALARAPLEQLPASLCLGAGRILDLVPDRLRSVGIGCPLRHHPTPQRWNRLAETDPDMATAVRSIAAATVAWTQGAVANGSPKRSRTAARPAAVHLR